MTMMMIKGEQKDFDNKTWHLFLRRVVDDIFHFVLRGVNVQKFEEFFTLDSVEE